MVYLNKAGEKYAVYHRNRRGDLAWTHPYSERAMCEVCRG